MKVPIPSQAIHTTIARIALIGISVFLLMLTWLPWWAALRLTVSIPFLYVLPGFFLTRTLLPRLDRMETTIYSVLFSVFIVTVGIFLVEEFTTRMTAWHMSLVVVTINLLPLAALLVSRAHQRN